MLYPSEGVRSRHDQTAGLVRTLKVERKRAFEDLLKTLSLFFLQEELKKQMNADLEETLAKNKWRTLGSIR